MTLPALRRWFQAPDQVKYPVAAPIACAAVGLGVLLLFAIAGDRTVEWTIAPLLACCAALATIAALRSAGVPMKRLLPGLRTTIAGAIAIAFLLALGAMLSAKLIKHEDERELNGLLASITIVPYLKLSKDEPGGAVWFQAGRVDAFIDRWAKFEREDAQSWFAAVYRSIPPVAKKRAREREFAAGLAKARLELLAPGTEAWKPTANLCREFARHSPNGKVTWVDYNRDLAETARNYTTLLGRPVTPKDLMPLIPGGKCD